jgi:hypothetical protein
MEQCDCAAVNKLENFLDVSVARPSDIVRSRAGTSRE